MCVLLNLRHGWQIDHVLTLGKYLIYYDDEPTAFINNIGNNIYVGWVSSIDK